jgi:hypothetical protein
MFIVKPKMTKEEKKAAAVRLRFCHIITVPPPNHPSPVHNPFIIQSRNVGLEL